MTSLSINNQHYEHQDISFDPNFLKLTDNDRKEILDSASFTSGSVYSSRPVSTYGSTNLLHATKTLRLSARGIRLIRPALPSFEKELSIYSTERDGELVYQSRRAKTCSGTAILYAAHGDTMISVVSSEYRWGPGRDPKIRLFTDEQQQLRHEDQDHEHSEKAVEHGAEIKVHGKWTSREQIFKGEKLREAFRWRYRREHRGVQNGHERKETVLVMELLGEHGEGVKRVAQLVRNEETRTPGTSKVYAGNGGELEMDAAALQTAGIPEELVVASCIMMLKKEIDRRRMLQIAMMAAVL